VNAAAGPPIWKRLPPSAEIRKPPMIAVKSPRSGPTPEAMAIAIESGSATIATVSPAMTSALRSRTPYPSRRTVTSLGVKSSAGLGPFKAAGV
jgi:hypothetical protein